MSDSKIKKQILNVRTVEGAPVLYSDYVSVNLSFFGIKLSFGTIDVGESQDETSGTLNVHVGLSPEHAKALHKLLGNQIEIYEGKFGALREPPVKEE